MSVFSHPLFKTPQMLLKKAKMLLPGPVSSEEHIFIVGAPRSGTALLEALLLAHPKIGGFGFETGYFMLHDLGPFDDKCTPPERIRTLLRETKNIVEFYDKLTKDLKERHSKIYWVEKTPQHVLRIRFLRRHFPLARILHIYRDGRDCFCSAQKQSVIRKRQGRNVGAYAHYWKKCIQSRSREGQNANILDVCYEDLVRSPAAVLNKVMQFLELSFLEEQTQLFKRKVKENPKLMQPIDEASIGRYKNEMDASEINAFQSIAKKELESLGYDLS